MCVSIVHRQHGLVSPSSSNTWASVVLVFTSVVRYWVWDEIPLFCLMVLTLLM